MRKHAGLDGEVLVTGSGEYMEVWREETYREYLSKQEELEERARNRENQGDGSASQAGSTD